MTIRQLKIFKAVCEEGSITQAAEKLYISQPAVSSTIIELEDYIGYNLFDRVSRNIVLNARGQLFLTKVNLLLEQYDELSNSFETIDEEAQIKIGSSITLSMDKLPHIIKDFQNKYPKTQVEVIIKNAEDIEKMVLNNEIDFGLVEGVVKNTDLKLLTLSNYEVIIVSSPQHLLTEQSLITLDDIVKENFLLREKGSAIRDVFDSTMLLQDVVITPLWTSINSQSIINATLENIGLAILPKLLVEDYLKDNRLKQLHIENVQMYNQNYLVYNKERNQSKSLKYLISIFRDYYKGEQ